MEWAGWFTKGWSIPWFVGRAGTKWRRAVYTAIQSTATLHAMRADGRALPLSFAAGDRRRNAPRGAAEECG